MKAQMDTVVTLEAVAEMASKTRLIEPNAERTEPFLLDKHYFRKHDKHAYYGQR